MIKRNLHVAIDHGTTNSAIAVLTNDGPKMVTHGAADQVLFPSYIFIYKNNRVLVGKAARDANLTDFREGDGRGAYKPRIDKPDLLPFEKAGLVKTPVELGTEVLQGMLSNCRESLKKDIHAAVITVPAMFKLPQCKATSEAARKAGLRYTCQLQEPVAAALAYGFKADQMEEDTWMVFDLGGGTLDVSLVMVRDGQIISPEGCQLGDNHCGGRHFDSELREYIIKERLINKRGYQLTKFAMEPEYAGARARLLLAVEEAKILLSTQEKAFVEVDGVLCQDDTGRDVKICEEIDRSTFERLISPYVEKACSTCEDLLKEKKIRSSDVSRLILVGGPTYTPFLRERLGKRLGIPMKYDVNPMTAVAEGAAIYAASQQIPDDIYNELVKEYEADSEGVDFRLKIEIPPVSESAKIPFQGYAEGCEDFEGYSVEIRRNDGGWSSSKLPLDEDGFFEVDALLISTSKPTCSYFTVTLLDPQGKVLHQETDVQVWHPYHSGQMSLPNPLMIELINNRTKILIPKGVKLPCEETGEFYTTREIKAVSLDALLENLNSRVSVLGGLVPDTENTTMTNTSRMQKFSALIPEMTEKVKDVLNSREDQRAVRLEFVKIFNDLHEFEEQVSRQQKTKIHDENSLLDMLRISVLEGHPNTSGEIVDTASSNQRIGELVIPAALLEKDLPEGSELQVTLSINASREVSVITYIPLLDDEFESVLQISSHTISLDETEERMNDLESRLEKIREIQEDEPIEEVAEGLKRIDDTKVVDQVRKAISIGRSGDGAAAEKATMEALSLQGSVEQLERHQFRPRVAEAIDDLGEIISVLGNKEEDLELLKDFLKEYEATKDFHELTKLHSDVKRKDKSIKSPVVNEMALQIGALLICGQEKMKSLNLSQQVVVMDAKSFWEPRLPELLNLELSKDEFLEAYDRYQAIRNMFTKDEYEKLRDDFLAMIHEAGPGPGPSGGNPIGGDQDKSGSGGVGSWGKIFIDTKK